MEIRSLATIDFDTIFEAFSQAFADYEMQNDKEQLRTMLARRGFDPGLSFAAFDGDKIVSFTFNGIGDYYGVRTAYDTGTGTLKEYRGQGLATRIFECSIPFLKEAGVKEYLLEVLQHNEGAVSVYRKLGFETVREFNYFFQDAGTVLREAPSSDSGCMLRPINISEYASIPGFWDFKPSWQNNFEAINRKPGDFICMGAFAGDRLAGYCVCEPGSGDITQLAVDRQYRRRGIASRLFHEMARANKYGTLKVVNTDVNCDSITAFLDAMGVSLKGRQFEMVKKL